MPVSKKPADKTIEPYWRSECGRAVVYVGDCREVMAQMEPDQFHAVVTDPPYNLIQGGLHLRSMTRNGDGSDRTQQDNYKAGGFMGQKWDGTGVIYDAAMWNKCICVAKPGAHLLSFGGTRTWHRMACAVEDAGWEVRDTIMWVYGSGFPKSHNVSIAIDKMLSAERKVVGVGRGHVSDKNAVLFDTKGCGWKAEFDLTSNVTDEAKQWNGFGTALKPAYEPVILARKPFRGSVAECVMENGTGGLNIDGCRVGVEGGCKRDGTEPHTLGVCGNALSGSVDGSLNGERSPTKEGLGRWPANLIHDGSDEVVELFPSTGPTKKSLMGKGGDDKGNNVYGKYGDIMSALGHDDDGGSAARYFYTAKADDSDRPHGKGTTSHPTVKPLDLMQYLVRLVCARGGTVLDPFMGSGSTGCAAISEGMRFVGIEQSQEYADIAVGRLRLALASAPPLTELVTHGADKCATTKDAAPTPRKLRG